jgi:molybdenum cofactor biosynthesis protein B
MGEEIGGGCGQQRSVSCLLVTISDTRTAASDEPGKLVGELIERAGHSVVGYRLISNDREAAVALFRQLVSERIAQAVIVNGGTSISSRDSAFEGICSVLEKRMDGFSHLLCSMGHDRLGSEAMLWRAVAGSIGPMAVFCFPGSVGAVEVAVSELIVPELGRLVGELER